MRKIKSIKEVDSFDVYDITVENDHCFELFNGVIAHNSLYGKDIVAGGQGSYLSSDNIYIIGKQQEKEKVDGKDQLSGFNFIINVEKSRYVKPKVKIPISVSFEEGISKYSGLLDIALELGWIIKPQNGWFSKVNIDTGEVEDKKYRLKDTNTKDFWEPILSNEKFKTAVYNKYSISSHPIISDTDIEEAFNQEETIDE